MGLVYKQREVFIVAIKRAFLFGLGLFAISFYIGFYTTTIYNSPEFLKLTLCLFCYGFVLGLFSVLVHVPENLRPPVKREPTIVDIAEEYPNDDYYGYEEDAEDAQSLGQELRSHRMKITTARIIAFFRDMPEASRELAMIDKFVKKSIPIGDEVDGFIDKMGGPVATVENKDVWWQKWQELRAKYLKIHAEMTEMVEMDTECEHELLREVLAEFIREIEEIDRGIKEEASRLDRLDNYYNAPARHREPTRIEEPAQKKEEKVKAKEEKVKEEGNERWKPKRV